MIVVNSSNNVDLKPFSTVLNSFKFEKDIEIYKSSDENWENKFRINLSNLWIFIEDLDRFDQDKFHNYLKSLKNDYLTLYKIIIILIIQEPLQEIKSESFFPVFLISKRIRNTRNGFGEAVKLTQEEFYLQLTSHLVAFQSHDFLIRIENKFYSATFTGFCYPEQETRTEVKLKILNLLLGNENIDGKIFVADILSIRDRAKHDIERKYSNPSFGYVKDFSIFQFTEKINRLIDTYFSGKVIENVLEKNVVENIGNEDEPLTKYLKRLRNTILEIGEGGTKLIFDYNFNFGKRKEKLYNLIEEFENKVQKKYEKQKIKNRIILFLIIIAIILSTVLIHFWPIWVIELIALGFSYYFLIYDLDQKYHKKMADLVAQIESEIYDSIPEYKESDIGWMHRFLRSGIEKEIEEIQPKISKIKNIFNKLPPTHCWGMGTQLFQILPSNAEIYLNQISDNETRKWKTQFRNQLLSEFDEILMNIDEKIDMIFSGIFQRILTNREWWFKNLTEVLQGILKKMNLLHEPNRFYVFDPVAEGKGFNRNNGNMYLFAPEYFRDELNNIAGFYRQIEDSFSIGTQDFVLLAMLETFFPVVT